MELHEMSFFELAREQEKAMEAMNNATELLREAERRYWMVRKEAEKMAQCLIESEKLEPGRYSWGLSDYVITHAGNILIEDRSDVKHIDKNFPGYQEWSDKVEELVAKHREQEGA